MADKPHRQRARAEIAYEDADTEEIKASLVAVPAEALEPLPDEEELDALEAMLDEYLAKDRAGDVDPSRGMDEQWWTWFESIEREGSYRFGLSGDWLRWFDALDRAA